MTKEKIYKAITVFGIDWYKVREKHSGVNEFLDTLRLDEDSIIVKRWHPVKGQFWGVAQLLKMLSKNTYLYEVIHPKMKRKVYFDIDIINPEPNIDTLQVIKDTILKQFPHAHMNISGYKLPQKHSYHIVLQNYHFNNSDDTRKYLVPFANTNPYFEPAVYGKYNNFKCINQSKPKEDAPIQAYIEGDIVLLNHTVLSNFDNDSQDASLFSRDIYAIKTKPPKFDFVAFDPPKEFLKDIPDTFCLANSSSIEKLQILPNPPRNTSNYLKHNDIFKVMIWCKQEGLSFEDFWSWNSQKDPSESRFVQWADSWSNADNYKCKTTFVDTLLIKLYQHINTTLKLRQYKKLHKLQHTKIINNNWLSADDNSTTDKYTILDVRMGGNKTGSIADYIHNHHFQRILFIVPRIALAFDLKNRFPEFTVYKDIKEKHQLKNQDKLIICAESLHYLVDCSFDCVILNEVETTLHAFKGTASTHRPFFLKFLKQASISQVGISCCVELVYNIVFSESQRVH